MDFRCRAVHGSSMQLRSMASVLEAILVYYGGGFFKIAFLPYSLYIGYGSLW